MDIDRGLIDEMVAHARRDVPNECCGMVARRDGALVRVHPARSVPPSPYRFEIEPGDLRRIVFDEIESAGLELGAIYHSHTRTAPEPSQTDINFAAAWPGVLWIIVGVSNGDADVRTWRIEGAEVTEVALDIR